MTDVIVVGAGPAGSTTALRLAALGHEVTLLDRHEFPRPKPCGDCLSPAATPLLDELGVLDRIEACRPARLAGWRIFAPSGRGFACRFDEATTANGSTPAALAIPRRELDTVLIDAARRAGVDVRTGVHVTNLLTDPRAGTTGVEARAAGRTIRLRARLVIGADGLRSVVARRLGMLDRRRQRLRKVSLTAHLHAAPGLDGWGEMHLAELACVGLAPVRACIGGKDAPVALTNVTLVVRADRFGARLRRDPAAFFRAQLERFPRLRERITLRRPAEANPMAALAGAFEPADGTSAQRSEHGLLTSGPFDSPTRAVVADGTALVGDAAGYFDPFTGEGIHHALLGARLLAEEADAALRAGDVTTRRLRRYAKRYRSAIREARLLQRLVELVTARPALADAAFLRLAAAPDTARALIAATAGLGPAHAVLAPRSVLSFLRATTITPQEERL